MNSRAIRFLPSRTRDPCMKKIQFVALFTVVLMLIASQTHVFCADEGTIKLSYTSDDGIDVDGDGLFDYLELKLETNITSTGNYLFEIRNLVDPMGRIIAVSASSTLYLEAGEQVITALLDGRMIRSSGLDPLNVSYASIISEDYYSAGFLYNVSLTRVYRSTEFKEPPKYEVGMQIGGWIGYHVNHFSSATVSTNDTGAYPEDIIVATRKIEAGVVWVEMYYKYTDGSEQNETIYGYLENESPIFPFIMPANLSAGDSFSRSNSTRINGTRRGKIFGRDREINYFSSKQNVPQPNYEVTLAQAYSWDRNTGVMIETSINITAVDLLSGERMYNNLSFSMARSNIFPQNTSVELSIPEEIKMGTPFGINATLLDYQNRSIEGKEVLFKLLESQTEIGRGTSDSNGNVKITYTIEKEGVHTIVAVFQGSDEYLSSEDIQVFTLNNANTISIQTVGVILISIAIIISIILFYIKRH